ncbi:MAG TPA: hypothetical protein VGJ26_15420 [Pirellulales bacterium]|jgi:hypothetical protein
MPLTARQQIESRLARGVIASPQFAETVVWWPKGVEADAVTIETAFVDRIHEEGTNEAVGDGATPRDPHGLRKRVTYMLDIPAEHQTGDGDVFIVQPEGWKMQFVRSEGRDSAKQTLRIVYTIPGHTRTPVLSPNARATFNKSV